jgi:catechol 2,3-dioxygenase-like lactoylglutathione lyase family enzyme
MNISDRHGNGKSKEIVMWPSALKIKIITPKLEETRAFFVTCLGMRVVEEWQEANDVGCIFALAGAGREALLEIYEGPQSADFAGMSLQFRTENLEAFKAGLPSTIEYRGPTERPWGSSYLCLTDPNGISVIVFDGGL